MNSRANQQLIAPKSAEYHLAMLEFIDVIFNAVNKELELCHPQIRQLCDNVFKQACMIRYSRTQFEIMLSIKQDDRSSFEQSITFKKSVNYIVWSASKSPNYWKKNLFYSIFSIIAHKASTLKQIENLCKEGMRVNGDSAYIKQLYDVKRPSFFYKKTDNDLYYEYLIKLFNRKNAIMHMESRERPNFLAR